jgi:hypothetical protein
MIEAEPNAHSSIVLSPMGARLYRFLTLPAYLWINACVFLCGAKVLYGKEEIAAYEGRLKAANGSHAANPGAPEVK